MIGNEEYRRTIERCSELIVGTTSWTDRSGNARAPFVESTYRTGRAEDDSDIPAPAAHRTFQILPTGTGPFRGTSTMVAGGLRDRMMSFDVVVSYHVGDGDGYDEKELRIVATQDAEAIKQRLTNPLNRRIDNVAGTGMISVDEAGDTQITRDSDRVLCRTSFRAWVRVLVEPAEGAAA